MFKSVVKVCGSTVNFSSTDWEQCIEEKAGKTDQNGIELFTERSAELILEISI